MFNLNFQDPATFSMEKIVALHHEIQFYLIIVLSLVLWMLFSVVNDFGRKMQLTPEVTKTSSAVADVMFYRASNLKLRKILHGSLLEIIWTTVPTIILLFIAVPSFSLLYLTDYAEDCMYLTVKVIGHQWYWSYELNDPTWDNYFSFDSYMVDESDLPFGSPRLLTVDNALFLPTNLPIRFLITSTDVLHSWAIPSFGIKVDAVPGRLNQASAVIRRSGVFYGQCSELCGVNHGFMPICVYAVDYSSFVKWVVRGPDIVVPDPFEGLSEETRRIVALADEVMVVWNRLDAEEAAAKAAKAKQDAEIVALADEVMVIWKRLDEEEAAANTARLAKELAEKNKN